MKPNDFTMNTDFLSLAGTGTASFTANFGAETISAGNTFTREQEFKVDATKGAIDRVLLSRNGSTYTVGNSVYVQTGDGYFTVVVFRPNSFTLRIRIHGYAINNFYLPAQTIKAKVASFKPPNIS